MVKIAGAYDMPCKIFNGVPGVPCGGSEHGVRVVDIQLALQDPEQAQGDMDDGESRDVLETQQHFDHRVAMSLGWITSKIHFKSMDEYNEHWRSAWVILAVWQLISFLLLCAICFI